MNAPRFSKGDVINSSLSSPQVIEDIRPGVPADFAGRHVDFTGEPCYVLRYLDGRKLAVVYSVKVIDSDHHLKGSDMFNAYEQARNAVQP